MPDVLCPICGGRGIVVRECDDPQCGDSTWDHLCTAGSRSCGSCDGTGRIEAHSKRRKQGKPTTINDLPQCHECVYWVQEPADNYVGDCCRHAPWPLVLPADQGGNISWVSSDSAVLWPRTEGDAFCGDGLWCVVPHAQDAGQRGALGKIEEGGP